MAEWIAGGFAAFLLVVVLARIIEAFHTENQQRTVTGYAFVNGILVSLGVSPFGAIARELAVLFKIVPRVYPEWVKALLTVEIALGMLYGVGVMYDSGDLPAVASFLIALLGGMVLPYAPVPSLLLLLVSWALMEVSDADRW